MKTHSTGDQRTTETRLPNQDTKAPAAVAAVSVVGVILLYMLWCGGPWRRVDLYPAPLAWPGRHRQPVDCRRVNSGGDWFLEPRARAAPRRRADRRTEAKCVDDFIF